MLINDSQFHEQQLHSQNIQHTNQNLSTQHILFEQGQSYHADNNHNDIELLINIESPNELNNNQSTGYFYKINKVIMITNIYDIYNTNA